jgi:hypothetical protein
VTLQAETLRLGDERDRLDSRLDELADQIVNADEPAALRQVASQVETRLSGLAYLVDEYGADATVTVRGLTAGEYARVEDRLAAMRAEASADSVPGAQTNLFAAAGLVDAPFADDCDDLDAALAVVADQPVGVAKWLYAQVDDRTGVEGNGYEPLSERLADRLEG